MDKLSKSLSDFVLFDEKRAFSLDILSRCFYI